MKDTLQFVNSNIHLLSHVSCNVHLLLLAVSHNESIPNNSDG